MKKNFYFAIVLLIPIFSKLFCEVDFEKSIQEFVLETKQISIPGHPHAFNPSIVRWEDKLLLSFREICEVKSPWALNGYGQSKIWLVFLNDDFQPISIPQCLPLGKLGRTDDVRLITSNNNLYMVYSDNRHENVWDGGFRTYIAELSWNKETFALEFDECLEHFSGESEHRREKNWVPFDFHGSLFLAYTLNPHRIFLPLIGFNSCETVCTNWANIPWTWGDLRGGTPALLIDNENYLSFFHSCLDMATEHSGGETMLHYFMGAYVFDAKLPFSITKISPEPIIGKGFYTAPYYEPYWKPVRVVFPCGFIFDEKFIWVSLGRQDHEMWILKLDREGLLQSLVDIK
jgi:predicted GH43/DUF377 family glycosyl hydrolase